MQELFKIQQGLKVKKDKLGDGGKFSYRTAEGILALVKPLLEETKSTLILTDTIWESASGAFFCCATATLYGESGKVAEAQGYAQFDDHEFTRTNRTTGVSETVKGMSNEQASGSASSYARKYALCGLFAIDDASQDPDGLLFKLIAEADSVEDINALIPKMKGARDDEKKAFNAQTENLGLVYDKNEKKYIINPNKK